MLSHGLAIQSLPRPSYAYKLPAKCNGKSKKGINQSAYTNHQLITPPAPTKLTQHQRWNVLSRHVDDDINPCRSRCWDITLSKPVAPVLLPRRLRRSWRWNTLADRPSWRISLYPTSGRFLLIVVNATRLLTEAFLFLTWNRSFSKHGSISLWSLLGETQLGLVKHQIRQEESVRKKRNECWMVSAIFDLKTR